MIIKRISCVLVLLFLPVAMSCAGPERELTTDPKPLEGPLAMPTGWYCPWCGREAPVSPWSPAPSGTGQMEHRSRRHTGGLQWNVPKEYPLHWTEGITTPQVGPGPMAVADARRLLEWWAADQPGMEVGEIEDRNELFEGTILKEGTPVGRVQVDKATGWFRQVE
jgi:hypothetical protein